MTSTVDSPFGMRSTTPAALGQALAALGRDHAVVHDELMAAPLVLRHKDVSAALRNSAVFSTAFYGAAPMHEMMIAQNGPEHVRQRRIHNRFFSAGASARYAERVAVVAERAVAGLGHNPELVDDLFARYPMAVFLDLLGIPDDLGDQGLAWVRAIVTWLGSPMNEELAEPGIRAFAELRAYTDELVASAVPSDNLLGEVIRAHVVEEQYSASSCSTAVVSLLLGGFETTIQMLSCVVASLLLNPDALARVRADRTLVDAALDESFRWANPSAGLYRLVTRDTAVADTHVAKDSMVYLCIAAAHFDPAVHRDPEVFDLDRNSPHLGFGLGPHYCVGAQLARIEARAALNALLDRFPDLRLDPEHPPVFHYGARGFVQHGTETLKVLT